MSLNSILPRDHWPHFLKLSLGVGSDHEMPLSRALHEIMNQISLIAGALPLKLRPSLTPDSEIKNLLAGLGFATSSFSPTERLELFQNYRPLLSQWGELNCLQRLATLYFGKCKVLRGRSFQGDRLHSRTLKQLRLIDTEVGRKKLTFQLLCDHPVDSQRIEDFKKAAESLCPPGYQIFIKLPVTQRNSLPIIEVLSVGQQRLQTRRLS